MKYLRLALALPPEQRHPMHQFVVESDEYGPSRQLHWSVGVDGSISTIFRVEGDPDEYVDALAAVDSVESYHVAPSGGEFYLYIREDLPERERQITTALDHEGLLIVPPIVYRVDGCGEFTLVGTSEAVQNAVDAVPEPIDVEVLEVGQYSAQPFDHATDLTDRQREAVRAAIECGYYETPRSGSVEDVADTLSCAPSTAAEHLRKAESSVMRRLVTNSDAGASR
ncbi:Predicted DNA binding protein, contains HTH domain [Natronoarchaeum philippinense]|uniref:Predicted DNA binding protein, contains HTH domain n=1 Tax=Natronoarchaeum philippinense TaxID=558529 RepID=A0A285N5Q4_NATPI|nr:helix-turn-helix domain-containing protein [Natronoarchaeum philippinense]SNZ04805.1 Predicted DNA binding protein, contains HTH domain [Natronoarchaeum philippinense]